jgi:hypothetical protein
VEPSSPRPSARRGLTLLALLTNFALFGVGLYFELHPRDRHDLWSAAGVSAVAILNSAALSVPPRRPVGARFVLRLRRIATLANGLLLLVALVIFGFEAANDTGHAALHWVALVVPPLVTIAALRTRHLRWPGTPALREDPPAA